MRARPRRQGREFVFLTALLPAVRYVLQSPGRHKVANSKLKTATEDYRLGALGGAAEGYGLELKCT